MTLTHLHIAAFRETVWNHYKTAQRSMPWREQPSPYWVMVSEVMLQQTQVGRVTPKFTAFIERFPTIDALAQATLADVLQQWSGLGYNRRAKFLWQAAQQIMERFAGVIPDSVANLISLPGIGKNTAGAILAYAHNQPSIFIETNIRTVYLHHFFGQRQGVSDAEILGLLVQTIDTEHPRDWYWALMDYGTHLKQNTGNNIAQSKQYTKQSKFAGSKRQIRGQVLKLLLQKPMTFALLSAHIADERLGDVLHTLQREMFITKNGDHYSLT